MATSLDRPGVKVRRQVTSVTPQALVPILRPLVVGPAFEVLDLYDGAALNGDAVLSAPARLVGTVDVSNPGVSSIRGKALVLSIKNGAPVTCTLPNNLQTSAYLLAVLNRSFTGVVFSLVEDKFLAVQSLVVGDGASIEVKAGTTAVLGFSIGQKAVGAGTYKNQKLGISFSALPAPRGNGALLDYDTLTDHMAAYYRQAGLIKPFNRTSAVVRYRKRHEFGREESGTWVNYGFSLLATPGTFAITDQYGMDNRTLVTRPLTAISDGTGSPKTTKVASTGAAATLTKMFHKPASAAIAIDTGATAGDPDNIGVLMMVAKPLSAPDGLPGAQGNNIRYQMVMGTPAKIEAEQLNSLWVITQTVDAESVGSVLPVVHTGTGSVTAAVSTKVRKTGRVTVEITTPGAAATAKFKWSIDDGDQSDEITTGASGVGTNVADLGVDITFTGVTAGSFLLGDTYEFTIESETLEGAADALDRSSVTLPGSGTVVGATADLAIRDVLNAYAVGVVGTVLPDVVTMTPDAVADVVPMVGGASSSLVFSGDPVGGFYGSLGNNLKLAVAESGAGTFTASGTGADPDALKTWTLAAGAQQNVTSVLAGGEETCTVTVNAATGKAGDAVGFPWAGANGVGQVTLVIALDLTDDTVTTDFSYNATTGKMAVTITFKYTTSTTFGAMKSALEGAHFVNDLLTITNSDNSGVPTDGSYVLGVDGTQHTDGADPMSASAAKTLINGTSAHNVLAAMGTTWDASCPVSAVTATQLTGGWDPVDFKEGVLDATNEYFHGVVVGERNLKAIVDPVDTLRTLINGKNLKLRVNGSEEQDIVFSTIAAGGDTIQVICDTINARFPADVAKKRVTSGANIYLELSSKDCTVAAAGFGRRGLDSSVQVVGGSAIGVLFHDGTDTTRDALYTGLYSGAPLALKEGDVLYNNGAPIGTVLAFENYAAGGAAVYENAVAVLDQSVAVTSVYNGWVAVATNLDFETDSGTMGSPGPRVQPLPEAYVDTTNRLIILKDNVVRDSTGTPVSAPKYAMYATYKALRKDLKSGVNIRSADDLSLVTPLTADNPLGLALQKAFEAGDGIVVSGVGVDEISEREPNGTLAAYQRAATWASTQEVYASGLLTHDKSVHDYFAAYVAVQSDEDHKKEQVVVFCPSIPTHQSSTVLGSGEANASSTATDVVTFSSEHLNVGAILADAGIDEADWANEDAFYGLDDDGLMREIYLNVTSGAKNYLVRSVSLNGDVYEVQVHCGEAGDNFWDSHEGNEDYFFATSALPSMQLDGEPASIFRRGQVVANTEETAEALRDLCAGYNSILVHVVGPDQVSLSVDGLETLVDGFYAAAIAAAQICSVQPATPLTGQNVPGVVNAILPEGMTNYEIGIAAAAGYSMAMTENGTTTWRDFLTTKSTPIEDFETSMVTPDHTAARVFRAELRQYVGPLAIDSSYLGRVSMVCDKVCKTLVAAGVYKSAKVQSISQDAADPRQIILEIARSVYYPARTILVILV